MEKFSAENEKQIKKHLANVFPSTEEFLLYAKPFLTNITVVDRYEKYLIILQKVGIKGIEGMASNFTKINDVISQNSQNIRKGILKIYEEKEAREKSLPSTQNPSIKEFMDELSFEKTAPLMSEATSALRNDIQKDMNELDEKIARLPKEEKIIVDFFTALLLNLFIGCTMNRLNSFGELASVLIKKFLLSYDDSMQALYNEPVFPKELLVYLKNIKIPNEEKLRAELFGTTHTIIETTNTLPTKIISALNEQIKLELFFENIEKYNFIMNLLVEKKYCQAKTYLWKDEENGSKGFLVAILKYLHMQGYYKDNKRLTNEQIEKITMNTFGLSVSIDTIKKTKSQNFNFDLKFIPLASSML